VVVYNDHGLNFFLDKLPTFAIGAAAEYRTVAAAGFDVTMCQEMTVDHAVCNPLILWLTARAALGAGSGGGDVGVREVAATYHVPISNTAAGMMLLEPAG
jgi:hypothetical protein